MLGVQYLCLESKVILLGVNSFYLESSHCAWIQGIVLGVKPSPQHYSDITLIIRSTRIIR